VFGRVGQGLLQDAEEDELARLGKVDRFRQNQPDAEPRLLRKGLGVTAEVPY